MKTVSVSAKYRWFVVGTVGCLLLAGMAGAAKLDSRPVDSGSAVPAVTAISPQETDAIHLASNDLLALDDGEYLSLTEVARYRAAFRARRPQVITHTISSGESAWIIAQRFGTDLGSLQALNTELDMENLVPGGALQVAPNFSGLVHKLQGGESVVDVAAQYGVSAEEVLLVNRISNGEEIEPGTMVFVPGARLRTQSSSRGDSSRRVSVAAAAMAPSPAVSASQRTSQAVTGNWIWPLKGGLFFSEYGYRDDGFHRGLDIAAPTGTPVVAARGGTVVASNWDNGYGLSVIVDHGDGLRTRYAHASKLLVSSGQTVAQGDAVILVGNTGNSTGPHLHFEVLVDGEPVNPRQYLP